MAPSQSSIMLITEEREKAININKNRTCNPETWSKLQYKSAVTSNKHKISFYTIFKH